MKSEVPRYRHDQTVIPLFIIESNYYKGSFNLIKNVKPTLLYSINA